MKTSAKCFIQWNIILLLQFWCFLFCFFFLFNLKRMKLQLWIASCYSLRSYIFPLFFFFWWPHVADLNISGPTRRVLLILGFQAVLMCCISSFFFYFKHFSCFILKGIAAFSHTVPSTCCTAWLGVHAKRKPKVQIRQSVLNLWFLLSHSPTVPSPWSHTFPGVLDILSAHYWQKQFVHRTFEVWSAVLHQSQHQGSKKKQWTIGLQKQAQMKQPHKPSIHVKVKLVCLTVSILDEKIY